MAVHVFRVFSFNFLLCTIGSNRRRSRELQGAQAKRGFTNIACVLGPVQASPSQVSQRATFGTDANPAAVRTPPSIKRAGFEHNSEHKGYSTRVQTVPSTATHSKSQSTAAGMPPPGAFYKRPLPQSVTAFNSKEGRLLFAEALAQGGLDGSYWDLSENFVTQHEPASCGTGTLAMVLNSLSVDPQQQWKGVWRWYFDENQLDCCRPRDEDFKDSGMSFMEMACCARCNGVHVSQHCQESPETSLDHFRKSIMETTMEAPIDDVKTRMVVSFSRPDLGQTGSGHFSPIGAYHPEKDLALIMDVARFKYHPFWVDVELLYNATQSMDDTTGQSRGYMLMSRDDAETPLRMDSDVDGGAKSFRLCWGELIQTFLEKANDTVSRSPSQGFADQLHSTMHGEGLANTLKVRGDVCRAGILWRLIEELSQTSTYSFVKDALVGSGCSGGAHMHSQHEVAVGSVLMLAAAQTPAQDINAPALPLHPFSSNELGSVVENDYANLTSAMQGEILKVRDQMRMINMRPN